MFKKTANAWRAAAFRAGSGGLGVSTVCFFVLCSLKRHCSMEVIHKSGKRGILRSFELKKRHWSKRRQKKGAACSSYARSCVLGLWCACAAFVQIVRVSLVNVADTARVRRVRLDPAGFAHHRRRHPISRPPPPCIQMILGAVHACVLCACASHARDACTCCVCACSACFRFARLRTTVPPCLVVYTHAYAHL